MKKTIVALWNNPNTGKTETLRALAEIIINNLTDIIPIFPVPLAVNQEDDLRLVVQINGRIIGIESQGDPNTNLLERLLELVNDFNCDVIICATRLRGETVGAVENIHENFDYETIWTSTYQVSNPNLFQISNRTKAEHLVDLLRILDLI